MDGMTPARADGTPARARPPEGYDTVEAFLTEARQRFAAATAADRENRDAGLDDLRFVAGEQWDESVKAKRIRKGQPCLTINTLPQFVGQVVGDIRINRPSIKVRPAEDGDVKVAEVRQGLIRHIETQSNAHQVYALAGEDQVSCGIGHFRVGLEWAANDSFDQDIRIRHVPNPFAVVWDPLSVDPTGADAEYAFVVEEMDRAAFEKRYPDAAASELTVPTGEASAGWVSRETVRVTEYWVMKHRERTLALVLKPPAEQPETMDITGREDELAPFIVGAEQGRPRVRKALRRYACMYLINGVELLEPQPYELAVSRIPILKVSGREVRVGERRVRYSLVRWAKDPIRMKNLWRSSAAQYLSQAPKSQWLIHAADEEEADQFRKAGKSGDPVLVYSGQTPPMRVDPPMAPNALLQEAGLADADIKDVTGLHDASLGRRSNETSGRAILARERQGDVATFMYHDNLHAAIREGGKLINELIPLVYDTARTVVVLGDDDTARAVRVNDAAGGELVDLTAGKYDVILEVGPSYSTRRAEAAESMAAFFQAVPGAGQVAGDLFARAQDWPMADAIAGRLRKALPPGLAEGEEGRGPVSPGASGDPRAAMAMQAEAMRMQAAQAAQALTLRRAELETAEQEAKTRLALARAVKAEMEVRGAD